MGKIQQLPPHEAQRIAAGEVVERPANIVKELLENSIDAGATEIQLRVTDGGKKSIHIIDNGCGMSPEDAHMCIKHHATSKIKTVNDLETIATYGFRGEALSSITSVSKTVLITKEERATLGTKLTIEAGEIIAQEEHPCTTGTNICIDDIFYNVPARKKFLKKRETEWRAILHLAQAFALSHLSCRFSLYHDEKKVFQCLPTDNVHARFKQLFPAHLSDHIHTFEKQELPTKHGMNLHVAGALTDHQFSRYDRNLIFLFINKRWIKNYSLVQAFVRGYNTILPPQKYPAGCVFIDMDPAFFDANIHPRKEDVMFLHPRIVEKFIEQRVQETLEQTITQKTEIQHNQSPTNFYCAPRHTPIRSHSTTFAPKPWSTPSAKPPQTPIQQSQPIEQPQPERNIQQPVYNQTERDYKIIGHLYNTYIIIQRNDQTIFIDQHAAHERILFHDLEKNFAECAPITLLFPQLVTLEPDIYTLVLEQKESLARYGVIFEKQAQNKLLLTALPACLQNHDGTKIIDTIVGQDRDHAEHQDITFALRTLMACKKAIKAGDSMSIPEMHALIDKLYQTPNKMSCPHGRPTHWSLTKKEIERFFQRDYTKSKVK